MLKKLAEKAGIPEEKLPMNLVENFGNPSGASIPLTAAYNLKEKLTAKGWNAVYRHLVPGLHGERYLWGLAH